MSAPADCAVLSQAFPSVFANTTNCCSFTMPPSGVVCSAGRVSSMFNGSVPDTFGSLDGLTSLDLSFNQLSGSAEFVKPLTNLEDLDLSANLLSADLSVFASLTKLSRFAIARNKGFTGTIADGFSRVENMTLFNVASNRIQSPFSGIITKWTSLAELRLHDNSIYGPIPADIGNLVQLKTLVISDNRINGTIPASFANLKNLTLLIIQNNPELGGVMPTLDQSISCVVSGTSISFADSLTERKCVGVQPPPWSLATEYVITIVVS
ncbi:hypothetical protein BC831DRAFT_433857 [Entophlyctis helioformis]|nr:hypothetical protein BC831DRAFT_433857 [Entophlyctis helioformis]